VTRGKSQMPAWGDLLKPEEVEALWAYVISN
jgi:mono/diheme cytochrome c family protein